MPGNALRLAVPHRVLVIGDPNELPPPSFDGEPVSVSESTIAVATQHEVDGEVMLRLIAGRPDNPPPVRLFSGRLRLPGLRLTICNTANEILLEVATRDEATVTVWANEPEHPSDILVSVD